MKRRFPLQAGVFHLAMSASFGCQRPSKTEPRPTASPAASASAVAGGWRTKPTGSAPHASSARVDPDLLSHASTSPDPASSGKPRPPPASRAAEKVDGAALRKRHLARLKADRSAVTVFSGPSALELGERLCEGVVPLRKTDIPILIKPNICGFDGFKNVAKTGDDGVSGRVTNPEFVRGVVQCLKKRGHTAITIAEGCGNSNAHWQRAAALSGFEAMAREEAVALVALDDDGVFDVQGDQPGKPIAITGLHNTRVPTLLMPKLLAQVLEHGLFISVPKLKAHRYSVVSLGIKGMQGTVQRSDAKPHYNQKWRMHAELKDYLQELREGRDERARYVSSLEAFTERILDVLEISLPDAVLIDGAPAMAGDGFQNLRVVPGFIAIGGTNPVLVDRVGAEYLGLWNNAALAAELGGYRSSPLILSAAKRYGLDLTQPELKGDGVEKLSEPRAVFYKALAPFSIERAAPARADSRSAPTQPEAHASYASQAPNIDGKIDTLWSNTPAVEWRTDYAGNTTAIQTRARFLWNEQALFALFELSQAELNVDTSRPTTQERERLYQEDCVELFLTPNPTQPAHYYEIELGPLGHWFDLEVDRTRGLQNVEWSSGVRLATTRDPEKKTSTLEVSITARQLLAALAPGARLPLGLYRMEGKAPRQYLAWSPPRTPKPNFHVPEAFGTLVVDGPRGP